MVVGADPVLEEPVRARPRRVQPHGPRLGLAELGPVGLQDQGRGEAVGLPASQPPDQVDALGDVAPLVAAPELEPATVVVEQMEEVVGLQQHVAELREGDAVLAALQPGAHRLLPDHLVDREVLAHVAQEVGQRVGAEPAGVVEQQPMPIGEVDEPLELAPDGLAVGLEPLRVRECPLVLLAARVADQARSPAHQGDRTVPGLLDAPHRAQLEEAAHVEAVGGRVEARVERQGVVVEQLGKLGVGHLVDQAPPLELGGQLAHRTRLPRPAAAPRLIPPTGAVQGVPDPPLVGMPLNFVELRTDVPPDPRRRDP